MKRKEKSRAASTFSQLMPDQLSSRKNDTAEIVSYDTYSIVGKGGSVVRRNEVKILPNDSRRKSNDAGDGIDIVFSCRWSPMIFPRRRASRTIIWTMTSCLRDFFIPPVRCCTLDGDREEVSFSRFSHVRPFASLTQRSYLLGIICRVHVCVAHPGHLSLPRNNS